MDWEEIAITELYKRFESIYKSVDKAVFPGLCSSQVQQTSSWPVLSHGLAYLTGATDRFGSPIIFIPHNEKLSDSVDLDLRGTIKYLVAATNASSADVGFVVLIDSRQSRWSSLAWVLRNVASCFPGELKMILALRPTNFLHATLSTIAMRYQKDEYNYKVPMELLACVENVWPWISKADLPRELGGELHYSHSNWLRRRLIIENLSTILKHVVERCKSYCTSLINDQDFPDDASDDRVKRQNEECKSVMNEVESLQSKGNEILEDDVWVRDATERESVSTSFKDVQHLCSLILEVKDTFGTFWETFETKRAGYLQLKSFEKNYKTAATRISCLIENLEIGPRKESISDDAISLGSPKYGMTEICMKACADGEDLMREHPYAIDCIKPKCEELKRLSHCFQTLLEERLQNEAFIRRTKGSIQEVNDWSGMGMKLLSVQNLDKAKTSDGVQEALNELEAFTATSEALKISDLRESLINGTCTQDQIEISLEECLNQFDLVVELFEKRKAILQLHPRSEVTKDVRLPKENPKKQTPPSKYENTAIVLPIPKVSQRSDVPDSERQRKLKQVMNELVETESKYVEELSEIVQGYGYAIEDETMAELLPEISDMNRRLLLGNLEEILLFHRHNLLPNLIKCDSDEVAIGNLFIEKASDFSLYYDYCHESENRKSFRKRIGENHAFFVECQRKLGHRLPLSAYLLKPVQRITKYQLLLQQMAKYSENSESGTLSKAVGAMMDVLKKLNDSMHEISIKGFPEDFATLGRLVLQASFQIQTESRRGKVKDFARSKFNKALFRHLFLYENGLLVCKKYQTGDDTDGSSKMKDPEVQNSYLFKRCLKAKQFTLTDTIKGCPRKFRLHCQLDDAELTVTTPSNSVKQSWIKSLQKCACQPKDVDVARPESPAKRAKADAPSRASPTRKRLDGVSKQESSTDARNSKVQRSMSLGKNTSKPLAKSFLGRQKSFAMGETTGPKSVSKGVNKNKNSKVSQNGSTKVTFGNIHGVEKLSAKGKSRTSKKEEKILRDERNTTTQNSKKKMTKN